MAAIRNFVSIIYDNINNVGNNVNDNIGNLIAVSDVYKESVFMVVVIR